LRFALAYVVLTRVTVAVFGPQLESLLVWVAVIAAVAHGPTRRRFRAYVSTFGFRRRFNRALCSTGVEPFASRPPDVVAVGSSGLGKRVELVVPMGTSPDSLTGLRSHLAAAFRVRDVLFERSATDGAVVTMTLSMRDPFGQELPPWPLEGRHAWSFSLPIPFGVDEEGRVVSSSLVEHHLLLGGEPGAGESNALLVVGAAALDPAARLHLLDGKLVELAAWARCADGFVGPDMNEAIGLLEQLRGAMDDRYVALQRLGKRKVDPSDGLAYEVLVCDELALYLNHPDKKAAQRFAEVLRYLLARGRAAGIVVVAATQKPSTDVVPSSLRDLFGYRWAMRCATREASDTILGSGWATEGYSAADIDARTRGLGLLRHEGAAPVKLRAFHLDDAAIERVAIQAGEVRRSARKLGA
jgi:hypothetical protein